jgi:hypothetical protein
VTIKLVTTVKNKTATANQIDLPVFFVTNPKIGVSALILLAIMANP